jgi:hypothetical protein
MWLLSQNSSQHCGVYTYILAAVELSSSSITDNRHRPLCPYSCLILLLFLVYNYLPLAHNLNSPERILKRIKIRVDSEQQTLKLRQHSIVSSTLHHVSLMHTPFTIQSLIHSFQDRGNPYYEIDGSASSSHKDITVTHGGPSEDYWPEIGVKPCLLAFKASPKPSA